MRRECVITPVRLFLIAAMLVALRTDAERPKISEDRELVDCDLTGWDCLNRLQGTARTPDGLERNRMKNRSAQDLTEMRIDTMDTVTFLKHVADFDAQTKGKHRT